MPAAQSGKPGRELLLSEHCTEHDQVSVGRCVSDAAEESPAPLPGSLRRQLLCRLVPLIALGYAFCNVDRSNIALAELKMRYDPTLNMTTIDYGIGSGIFFAGYGAMQLPALQLIQHVGPRPVIGTLLISWGLLGSAIGAITSVGQLYALRFALGLTEAGYYPGWCAAPVAQRQR